MIKKLFVIGAVAAALTGTSFAKELRTEEYRSQAMAEPYEDGELFPPTGETGVDVLTYPFRAVGRTAVSVLHTPSIVADTVRGERVLVNEEGEILGRVDDEYSRFGS